VEIVSVPLHGTLMDPATNLTLKAGDVLATGLVWPSVSQVGIVYTGEEGYFNQPSSAWDGSSLTTALSRDSAPTDSFVFRVVSQTDAFASTAVTQRVAVVNVNDASVLRDPANASSLFIYAYTFYSFNNEDYDREARPHVLQLAGLSVVESDEDDLDAVTSYLRKFLLSIPATNVNLHRRQVARMCTCLACALNFTTSRVFF
jgi:hypothetical protein